MDPLPHFRAAVIYLGGAILIKQHQRAGLIEMRGRKRNPELYRRDRDAAFAMRMFTIPFLQLFATRFEIAFLNQFMPNALEPIVFNFLPVMCRVGFACTAIQISCAKNFRRKVELTCDAIDDFFNC